METRKSINFKIGNKVEDSIHQIDIWLDDILLNPFDNNAYLPQFISSMKNELMQLQQRKINPNNFFLDLGPTTDDCSARVNLKSDIAEVIFELDENRVYKLTIGIEELISIYQSVINKLSSL